jgi:hypothetical protein
VEALKHWLMDQYLELPEEGAPFQKDEERFGREILLAFEVTSGHTIERGRSVRATLEAPFDDPVRNGDLLLDLLDFTCDAKRAARYLKLLFDNGRSAWTIDLASGAFVRRVPGAEAALAAIDGMPGAALRLHSVDEGVRASPGPDGCIRRGGPRRRGGVLLGYLAEG